MFARVLLIGRHCLQRAVNHGRKQMPSQRPPQGLRFRWTRGPVCFVGKLVRERWRANRVRRIRRRRTARWRAVCRRARSSGLLPGVRDFRLLVSFSNARRQEPNEFRNTLFMTAAETSGALTARARQRIMLWSIEARPRFFCGFGDRSVTVRIGLTWRQSFDALRTADWHEGSAPLAASRCFRCGNLVSGRLHDRASCHSDIR